MVGINDYKCWTCGDVQLDEFENPGKCLKCRDNNVDSDYQVTFENWTHFNCMRDVYGANQLVDDKGRRRAFAVEDCPISRIEIGLQNNQGDNGLRTFNRDQQEYYQGRYLKDGDTPTLRREILRERTKNLRASGADAPEAQ